MRYVRNWGACIALGRLECLFVARDIHQCLPVVSALKTAHGSRSHLRSNDKPQSILGTKSSVFCSAIESSGRNRRALGHIHSFESTLY